MLLWLAALATLALACGSPAMDPATDLGKQAILDQVELDLNAMDCTDAVLAITPLYNSTGTDNSVRMHAASAYGCDAGINLFSLITALGNNSAALTVHPPVAAKEGLWPLLAQLFPSVAGKDYMAEGALLATDALQAALKPAALVLPLNQVNSGTNNVGSVFQSDRIDDANLYLVFTSMAALGSLGSRYALPNSSFSPTSNPPLPWTTAAAVTSDGCAYASALLNLLDAITAVEAMSTGPTTSNLGALQTSLSAGLSLACQYGCNGAAPAGVDIAVLNPTGKWVQTGCAAATACPSGCPTALRDRHRCASLATDQVSCAAAGIVNFVNASLLRWQ